MNEFINTMLNAGITPPSDFETDGQIHRFYVEGDRTGSKNGWYVLFSDPLAGAFGDWKRDVKGTWSAISYKALSPEMKVKHKANMENAKRAREQEQELIHAKCRSKCTAIWDQAQPAPADHPYLAARGVKSHGLKIYNGMLMIPVSDGTTLHGLQFISQNGYKRFETGTNKRGKYYLIGDKPSSVLYLTEGYATAASVYAATGKPVAVCFDAGNLKPVLSTLHQKMPEIQMVVCADNDRNNDENTGVIKATEAARACGALLSVAQFPNGIRGTDYNDLGQACGLDEVRRQVEEARTVNNDQDQQEPFPLPNDLPPVKPFEYDLLPLTIKPWIKDICERMQCPPDFVAIAVITALGSVIGRKVGIRPQDKTTWTVVPNMWGIIIGKPGVMKSPALNEALKPLSTLANKAVSEFSELKKQHNVEAAKADAIISDNEKKIKKIAGDENKDEELTRLLQKNESLKEQRDFLLEPRRYLANDSSYQALGELLRHNGNGILVFRDELVSLIKSLDREEHSDARGFYLQGWNGDSDYTFDRIGRGMNLHISGLCISLLGGTQPGKISEYVRYAIKGGSGDDGLMQRFGLMVWPDVDSKWYNVDRQPDAEAENRVFRIFERLDVMQIDDIEAEQDINADGDPNGIPYLRMTPEAQKVFLDWREELENNIRGDKLPEALANHFAKYRKLVPSLALIIHLAEGNTGAVCKSAVAMAIGWAVYLESHAWRVYGSQTHEEVKTAKKVLAKIKQNKLKGSFSSRDVWRPNWSMLTDREKVKGALDLLVDYRWLNVETHRDTGGRPSTSYLLNPAARL